MSLKKQIFSWLTLQRNNKLGKFLGRTAATIIHALDNKNNDNLLSGEYRIWEDLKSEEIKVIFDVGANIGAWSNFVNSQRPEASIHSFEPVVDTFKILESNTASIKNITLNNFALSDQEEEIEFNFYPKGSYFSSIYDNQLGAEGLKITILCITGDQYCEVNQIEQIDFLKIDTEGSEHKVLKGFTRMLSEGKIKMIQFEYGDMCIDSGFLLKDYYQLLESYGFKIGKIYPDKVEYKPYDKKMENFILSNFLAIYEKI